MTWELKSKTSQEFTNRLLTSSGDRILVGSSENLVLIYAIASNNWDLKSKSSPGSWSLKTKIES